MKDPTLLGQAIVGGDVNIVRLLLEAGAPVNSTRPNYGEDLPRPTPLVIATTTFGNHALVALLLAKGADPTIMEGQSRTALSNAVAVDDAEVVKLLVEHGAPANPELSRIVGSPLQNAILNGDRPLAEYLVEHGALYGAAERPGFALLNAAAKGDLPTVKRLSTTGTGLTTPEGETARDAETRGGVTALHIAAFLGRREIVEALLVGGISPETKTRLGQTLLHWAALGGDVAVTQLLLAKGATATARDQWGQTPLHLAAYNGSQALIVLLLSKKADPNAALDKGTDAPYEKGMTPLHRAAYYGNRAAVLALIAGGAQVNVQTSRGTTPLHLACRSGSVATVAALLDKGASPKIRDATKHLPLWFAVQNNRGAPFSPARYIGASFPPPLAALSSAATTTSQAPNVTASPRKGTVSAATPSASPFDRAAVVALLLSRGENTQIKGAGGTPFLLEAVSPTTPNSDMLDGGDTVSPAQKRFAFAQQMPIQVRIVKLLLDAGASPNASLDSEVSARSYQAPYEGVGDIRLLSPSLSHIAVLGGNPAIVKLLLDKGAAPNAEDGAGRTPFDWVIRRGEMSRVRVDVPFAPALYRAPADGIMQMAAAPDMSDPTSRRDIAALMRAKGAHAGTGPFLLAIQNKAEAQVHALLQDAPQLVRSHALGTNYELNDYNRYVVTSDPRYDTLTPLQLALITKQDTLARLFIASLGLAKAGPIKAGSRPAAGTRPTPQGQTAPNVEVDMALLTAIRLKNWAIVDVLLHQGANINARDNMGNTLLHGAARTGDVALLEELVKRGADVNAWDAAAMTPLAAAQEEGTRAHAAVEFLQKHGGRADANIQRLLYIKAYDRALKAIEGNPAYAKFSLREGDTFLHVAVRARRPELVAALLKEGANPNALNEQSLTPLQEAVNTGDTALVTLLLDKGANPNFAPPPGHEYVDSTGQRGRVRMNPVIYSAIIRGDLAMVKLLLQRGARRDIKDVTGLTPLQFATANQKDKIAALLRPTPAQSPAPAKPPAP